MRQFFVNEKLEINDTCDFDRAQSHHIADVLRMKNGDEVRIVDSSNRVFNGVLNFENGKVRATLTQEIETEEQASVTCVAALIKKEKWELMIQNQNN